MARLLFAETHPKRLGRELTPECCIEDVDARLEIFAKRMPECLRTPLELPRPAGFRLLPSRRLRGVRRLRDSSFARNSARPSPGTPRVRGRCLRTRVRRGARDRKPTVGKGCARPRSPRAGGPADLFRLLHLARCAERARSLAGHPHDTARCGYRDQRRSSILKTATNPDGHRILDMTADELRAISRKLRTHLALHPDDKDARSIADRCGEIAALLEASAANQCLRAREPGSGSLEDRILRIASGAPLTRREIRLAGIFALVWF
jgi:hypothetical protein